LVAETWSVTELLSAGWTEADPAWEVAAEGAAEAASRNDNESAKSEAGHALQLARANFDPGDPRLGTSLANYGVCLRLAGDAGSHKALFREAIEVWRRADAWIARMDAPRVARSSLFHMRMEARHREVYRERWLKRWKEIADEATAKVAALSDASYLQAAAAADALARWRRERPAMLNDTRKLMAASFLLLAPPAA
jgi:hypothetical protein